MLHCSVCDSSSVRRIDSDLENCQHRSTELGNVVVDEGCVLILCVRANEGDKREVAARGLHQGGKSDRGKKITHSFTLHCAIVAPVPNLTFECGSLANLLFAGASDCPWPFAEESAAGPE
jgi:hypothetical protein